MKPADLRRLGEAAGLAFTRDRVRLAAVRIRQAALVDAGEDESEAERREIQTAMTDPASAMALAAYRTAADARRRARAKMEAALEAEAAEAVAIAAASFRKTQAVAFLERRVREAERLAALKREEDALEQFVSLRATAERARAARLAAAPAPDDGAEERRPAEYVPGAGGILF